MLIYSNRWLPMLAGVLLLVVSGIVSAEQRQVFGWIEKVVILPWGIEVKAKLDSGALTSSLDARDIEIFHKEGEQWVRFRLKLEDLGSGERFTETIERQVQRNLILRGAGGQSRRPSVLMKLCIGDRIYEEEFSIRNRKKMNYPVLLGRRTIQHLGLLDVKRAFLTAPSCSEDSALVLHQPSEED